MEHTTRFDKKLCWKALILCTSCARERRSPHRASVARLKAKRGACASSSRNRALEANCEAATRGRPNTKKVSAAKMSPRRQFGLSITFVDDVDDDAVMRVSGIVEKEPSPSVAVVIVAASRVFPARQQADFSCCSLRDSLVTKLRA